METIRKANKIHTCDCCEGNIQKGEKYIDINEKHPRYDFNEHTEEQVGIEFYNSKRHIRQCGGRLIYAFNYRKVLTHCNKSIHSLQLYGGEDGDDVDVCEWCGIEMNEN